VALLEQADLPLALPSDFEFVAGIDLELGTDDLALPAGLAVPVGTQLAAGTTVYFLRAGSVPDENGVLQPIWLQEEVGTVGSDGMARTSSPPLERSCQSRQICGGPGRGSHADRRVIYSSRGADTSTHQNRRRKGSTAVMTVEGRTFAMALPPGAHELKFIDIPPQRKRRSPCPGHGGAEFRDVAHLSDRSGTGSRSPPDNRLTPHRRRRGTDADSDGAQLQFRRPPLQVAFEWVGSHTEVVDPELVAPGELRVHIPRTVPLGLAAISLRRRNNSSADPTAAASSRRKAARFACPFRR